MFLELFLFLFIELIAIKCIRIPGGAQTYLTRDKSIITGYILFNI